MEKALALARKGIGLTGVNPLVGAILVKNGRLIGKGYHIKAKLDHAEIVAMKGLSRAQTKGSTFYVTLEPCCHTDKVTPPCTEKLLDAGIKKVVVAMKDPNKKVNGKGMKILRAAGIEVEMGLMARESEDLNEFYIYSIGSSLPFLTIKHAMSLDGKIAARDGSSSWISNPEARKMVHKMRSTYDAVMTSGVTVAKDNPQLTVRLVRGRNPRRIVVDWGLDTDVNAKVYQDSDAIIVTSLESDKKKGKAFAAKGIQVRRYDKKRGLRPVLKDLYAGGIGSVLVEAGGRFAASLLRDKLVNKYIYFIAPIYLGADGIGSMGELGIGNIKSALRARIETIRKVDDNLMVEVLL